MAQATPRQLSYLKSLANRAGQTFTYPKTAAQASAEIKRLKNTRPSTRVECRVERKLIADQIQAGPLDAARVREDEIAGHGSSATWVQNREQDPRAPEGSRPRRHPPASAEGRAADRAGTLQHPRRREDLVRPAGGRDRQGHRSPPGARWARIPG